MKVLQINNYAYLKGGSEKVFLDTTELLTRHGHDVRIFSAIDENEECDYSGELVKIKPWNQRFGLIEKINGVRDFIYNKDVEDRLDAFLRDFKPDIAHLHIYYGRLSNSIIKVLKRHSIPIVQSVHEYRLLCPAYTCLSPRGEICEKCADSRYKLGCIRGKCIKSNRMLSCVAVLESVFRDTFFNNQKIFSKFIMVSKFIRDKHISHYPELKEKCEVLYNMIDTEKYADYRVDIDCKKDYYLYVGRLSHEKGLKTLIDVFRSKPDLHLRIAGTGPLEEEITEYLDSANVKNITLTGFLSGDKLYSMIAQAKYIVVPSEWYENNPISVLEALSLGTPVIGSSIGGIPELVVDGETGFLFTPKDQEDLGRVIDIAESLDRRSYALLVENGKKFISSNCSMDIHYDKLLNIYQSVIGRR